MRQPFFSIVVCNYNYERFVGAALDSCLGQDYPAERMEVIVVDDGSGDRSRTVIESRAADARVRVLRQPNRGQGAAFAAGAATARGDFVCLLDSDDFCFPDKLREIARRLDALSPLPRDIFLCHDLAIHDDAAGAATGETWFQVVGAAASGPGAYIDRIQQQFPFAVPSGQVYSRPLLERLLEGFPLADWRMAIDSPLGHCALLTTGYVHYVQRPLAAYRVHGANDGAALVDGRYVPRPVWQNRAPRMLRHLERYLDTLQLDLKERARRLSYIKRKERRIPAVAAGRRLLEPLLSFVVDGTLEPAALEDAIASIRRQTHDRCEVVLVGQPGRSLGAVATGVKCVDVPAGTPGIWARWGAGYRASGGECVAFMDAPFVLDPLFAEVHVRAHQFRALVGATHCPVAGGGPEQQHPDTHAGPRAGHLPPLARQLSAGRFPPLCGTVLRRTALLDALFRAGEAAEMRSGAIAGDWRRAVRLAAQSTCGSFFLERAYVAAPLAVAEAVDPAADAVSAGLIFEAYCLEYSLFCTALPAPWHARFIERMREALGMAAPGQLAAAARRAQAPAALIGFLEGRLEGTR